MKIFIIKRETLFISAICLFSNFFACKTEDVTPKVIPNNGSLVTISIDNSSILENGGSAQLTATLSQATNIDVEVKFIYTGTALFNVDYSSNTSIVIPAGSISNSSSLLALQDTLKEGIETVVMAVDTVLNGIEDGSQELSINIEDDDTPPALNLIVNEILYDPSNSALDGDANGDGVYLQSQDEFLELFNNSTKAIDMSGFKIFDATNLATGTPNHLVPNGTILPPKKALVIFGGGTPTGTFGGALVQKSTSGDLNLSNAGDLLTIKDSSNIVVLTLDITPWSDNPNESYTRNPDITGSFEQHATNTTIKFSPGTKVNGSPF